MIRFSHYKTHHFVLQKATVNKSSQPWIKKKAAYTYLNKIHKAPAKKPMYRDTRLGSSTKKHKTDKKNGAVAVTTSPK